MKGIFFIVGTGRCGTNLCQRMLDLHPDLKVVTETHFIPTLVRLFKDHPISLDEFVQTIEEHYVSGGKQRWIDKHLGAAGRNPDSFQPDFQEFCSSRYIRTISDFVEAFFEFCYGEGSYLLGDKTPQYGLHMKDLIELWPQARFIHMIRDGRYAATSMQKHPGIVRLINGGFPEKNNIYSYRGIQVKFSTDPVELIDCIWWWEKMIKTIRQESERIPPSAYLEVHYENLLLHPVYELRRIAEFLNVSNSPRWLIQAFSIPRFFSLWTQKDRLSREDYCILTAAVRSTLEMYKYPASSFFAHRLMKSLNGVHGMINWMAAKWIIPLMMQMNSLYQKIKICEN